MAAESRLGFFKTLGVSLVVGVMLAGLCFGVGVYLEAQDTRASYEADPRGKDARGRPLYRQVTPGTEFSGEPTAYLTMGGFLLGVIATFVLNYVPAVGGMIDQAMGVEKKK